VTGKEVLDYHVAPNAFLLLVALCWIVGGLAILTDYIRADDTTIAMGNFLARRRLNRKDLHA
jgi:hypothetical protein